MAKSEAKAAAKALKKTAKVKPVKVKKKAKR